LKDKLRPPEKKKLFYKKGSPHPHRAKMIEHASRWASRKKRVNRKLRRKAMPPSESYKPR